MNDFNEIEKIINLNLLYSKNKSTLFIDRKENKIFYGLKDNVRSRNTENTDFNEIEVKDDNCIEEIYNMINENILSDRNHVMMYGVDDGTHKQGSFLRIVIGGDSAPMSIEITSDNRKDNTLLEQIADDYTNHSGFRR